MAFANSHLLVKSLASTTKENPQNVLLALETFLTYKKANPTFFTNELATLSKTAIGLASSIIFSSSPKADTQLGSLNYTCPPIACIHPVSTFEPTNSMLSPNASRHTYKVS
jgi:hypothetical protein